jgi:hypothetical protein
MRNFLCATGSKLAAMLCLVIGIAPITASADYLVSTPGIGTQPLAPSNDTLTLNAGSATTPLGSFNLQPGIFFVGDSGMLSGTFSYTFNESITIDGDTELVPILVQLIVTNPQQANTDTLSILTSPSPVFFAGPNVDLTIQSYGSPGLFVSQSANFTLPATLTEHVPEPGTFVLLSLGVAGLGFSRRKKA